MANPFRGEPVEQLLLYRKTARAAIAEGRVVINAAAGGKSVGKQVAMTYPEMLRYANEELRRIDPDTFGERITETVVSFS